jgi:hypothetical protein
MMFAVEPEAATLAEGDEFADTAADSANAQADEEQAQPSTTSETLRFAAESPLPPAPSAASGTLDNSAGAAANLPGEAAQPDATFAPEPTLLPTDKPSATPSPTSSPSTTPTLTETPTPTPSATTLPISAPVPSETAVPGVNTGLILIVAAVLLLIVAIVTTIIRRRG